MRAVWLGIVVAGCGSGGTASGGLPHPEVVGEHGGISVREIGARDGMVYARIVNDTGDSGLLFRVRLDSYDPRGEELGSTENLCRTVTGGTTVVGGAEAHCLWHGVGDDIASVEVGFVGADPVADYAPLGLFGVVGDPTYTDAGSSFGTVEAELCQNDHIESPTLHQRTDLDVIVLDDHGLPWDEGGITDLQVTDADPCVTGTVGGLEMPENPRIIATP